MACELTYRDKILTLQGSLNRRTVPVLYKQFKRVEPPQLEAIDLAAVRTIDSAGVAFLDSVRKNYTPRPELRSVANSLRETIKTFSSLELTPPAQPQEPRLFEKMGAGFLQAMTHFREGLYLTADIFFWSVVGIFNRKGQRKGAIIQQSLLIGADAVGIICLLSLILGLILALQSAAQLRQFGANIYVADLIAVSMVREMGPMMTAIIVAGRSGSAFASEIATMQVTEEVDALKMMAINPLRYVVAPKFNAITICMPLLVTLSIVVGILGGLIIGITYLDLSASAYFNELLKVLTLKDILIGMSKSIFFAWVIIIIGSYYGFHVSGGAEGVGRATTRSVVASVFAVIVLDAIFSLIYMI